MVAHSHSALFVTLVVGNLLVACGGDASSSESESTPQSERQSLEVQVNPRSLAFEYTTLNVPFPAGVAGGTDTVFIGSPFEGRVLALSRLLGRQVGELPPPPNGFVLPFILKQVGPRRVAVLDAGGFPSPLPLVPANPTIYEYEYDVGPRGTFSAHLARTVSFASAFIGFSEDITRLDDGRYLLSDAALGSIWIAKTDGTIVPGIVPKTFAAEDAIPQLKFCANMALTQVGGLPFLFTDSTLPGVSPIAVRNGTVYFASPCAEGVFSFPLAALSDNREPFRRADDIRLVSRKPASELSEELLDATFNPFDANDPFLYAADAMQLRLIKIDVRTGLRQVVANDPKLFDFPSSVAFLPPLLPGVSEIVVVSNQQQRTPLTNDAVTVDTTVRPFIVSKTLIQSPTKAR